MECENDDVAVSSSEDGMQHERWGGRESAEGVVEANCDWFEACRGVVKREEGNNGGERCQSLLAKFPDEARKVKWN